MREVLRSEKKFLLTKTEAIQLSHKFEQVLRLDPHSGSNGYLVRSLYFDTMHDSDLWEKYAGTEVRRKIRLRTYSADAKIAYLEMKQKQGANQKKRSLELTREDAIKLINLDYSVLLKYDTDFARELYVFMTSRFYRPKVVIDYKRKAFIGKENSTRITFDSEISANQTNYNIFDPKLVMIPVFDKDRTVLEVKFNGFLLSYIKDTIGVTNKSELSVSKYVMARANY